MADPICSPVGVVLWEILTGRRLFQGQQVKEVISRIMLGDIPAPSTIRPVAPDLERVVTLLLANDREARYATAREAVAGLMQCRTRSRTAPANWGLLVQALPAGQPARAAAPKGTNSSGLPSRGPITNNAPEVDISDEGTKARSQAASPADLEPLSRASSATSSRAPLPVTLDPLPAPG